MPLLNTLDEKRILFAENDVDRWLSAGVARGILDRLQGIDTISVTPFDITVLIRMANVLHISAAIRNPFQAQAIDLHSIEMNVAELLRPFT